MREEECFEQHPTQEVVNDTCNVVEQDEGAVVAKSDGTEELDEQRLILKKLLLAHETWFDVSRDYKYANHMFPGYAEFHSHGEKYVLVKRAKLWEVDAHEYIFFELADALSGDQMREWIDFMTTEAVKKVDPDEPNHMTSYVSLILIANSVEDSALKPIKTRFHKELKMGMAGWIDMRLAVIDLKKHTYYTNGMGKEFEPQLRSVLDLPAKKKFFRR